MRREQNNLVSACLCGVSKTIWFLHVSVSGNRCLVPQSVIPVDASDSFDTILDVVRAGLYKSVILR